MVIYGGKLIQGLPHDWSNLETFGIHRNRQEKMGGPHTNYVGSLYETPLRTEGADADCVHIVRILISVM